MHSNSREDIKVAFAGDIIALAGLKDTTTGDTICDIGSPVVLETMTFPNPVIEIAIEPKTKMIRKKCQLVYKDLLQRTLLSGLKLTWSQDKLL